MVTSPPQSRPARRRPRQRRPARAVGRDRDRQLDHGAQGAVRGAGAASRLGGRDGRGGIGSRRPVAPRRARRDATEASAVTRTALGTAVVSLRLARSPQRAADVCATLHVARPDFREAMRSLVAQGLVAVEGTIRGTRCRRLRRRPRRPRRPPSPAAVTDRDGVLETLCQRKPRAAKRGPIGRTWAARLPTAMSCTDRIEIGRRRVGGVDAQAAFVVRVSGEVAVLGVSRAHRVPKAPWHLAALSDRPSPPNRQEVIRHRR